MSHSNGGRVFWFKLWVEIVAGITLAVSIGSAFSQMQWGAWAGLVGALIWTGFRIKSAGIRISADGVKANRWFSFLAGLCFVSLCFGPHCFLDSYSYRIPQMLLWLQEGHPWSVPDVDMRINQMPHVWSFLSAAFFLPFGEKGLALPNLISYLLLFGVLKSFAESVCDDQKKTRWILLIFMASPVMVMQAASNDNVLTCITLLAISVYFVVLQRSSTSSVVYSALAFALCCGIKPQYVTLAPLWLIWFLCGRQAPVRVFRWHVLLWLAPLVILCSPLPTFSVNYFAHGSVSHPVVTPSVSSEVQAEVNTIPSIYKVAHSLTSLGNQMLALPVNPMAGKLTEWMHEAAEKNTVLEKIGFGRQRVRPLLIPEDASFGFFATIPFLIGLGWAIRRKCTGAVLAAGSFLAMLVAIFLTTPGTLGRSFIGFFVVMLPFSFGGLATLSHRLLAIWGGLCLLIGMGVVVINPACPLWPVKTVSGAVSHVGLKQQLLSYAHYSQRHHSGWDLVQSIPEHEQVIGVVVDAGVPLAELWRPYSLHREVKFYSSDVCFESLNADGVSYLIVKCVDVLNSTTAVSSEFLHQVQGDVIETQQYISYMQRGPEPWFLIRINKHESTVQ
jgi:hypothetical protein